MPVGLRTHSSPSTHLTSTPGIGVPQETTSVPSTTRVAMPRARLTANTFSAIA